MIITKKDVSAAFGVNGYLPVNPMVLDEWHRARTSPEDGTLGPVFQAEPSRCPEFAVHPISCEVRK